MSNVLTITTFAVALIVVPLCVSNSPLVQETDPNSNAFALRPAADRFDTTDQRLKRLLSLIRDHQTLNEAQSAAMLIARVSPLDGIIGQCRVSSNDGTILMTGE